MESITKIGQIAMETVLLYGLTILIVTSVVAYLFSSGVLDTSSLLPEQCYIHSQDISCKGYSVVLSSTEKKSGVKLELFNNLDFPIEISKLSVTGAGDMTGIWNNEIKKCDTQKKKEIYPYVTELITIENCDIKLPVNSKIKGIINITYTPEKSQVERNLVGEISTIVKEGCFGIGEEICNNKDDDCNGFVDDGLGILKCGTGACENEVPACLNGKENQCIPKEPLVTEETIQYCNGIDDDCDGVIDEECCACSQENKGKCGIKGMVCDGCFYVKAGNEICDDKDNDCDGETGYDSQDGIHGDNDCPLGIVSISAVDTNIIENTNFNLFCTTSLGNINSIDAFIGSTKCSFNSWNGNTASFSCNAGPAGNKIAKCSIDSLKSYAVLGQEEKTITINVLPSSCSAYTSSSLCEADSRCDYCLKCSGTKYSQGENRCVTTGTCLYSCWKSQCSAACDPTQNGCVKPDDSCSANSLVKYSLPNCKDDCSCTTSTSTTLTCSASTKCQQETCNNTIYYCTYDSTWQWRTTKPLEKCNDGIDNNCNNQIDEGCCTNDCTTNGQKTCTDSYNYKTCGNYDADSCLEWSSITSCGTNMKCESGNCVVKKQNGVTCSLASECYSGYCVDGYCCDTSCTGTCKRCNTYDGTAGTCHDIANIHDPDNECAGTDFCGCGTCIKPTTCNPRFGDSTRVVGATCLLHEAVGTYLTNTPCQAMCESVGAELCYNYFAGSGLYGGWYCDAYIGGTIESWYGGQYSRVARCEQPDRDNDGHLSITLGGDDCNDDNAAYYPGAAEPQPSSEWPPPQDYNCDGQIWHSRIGTKLFTGSEAMKSGYYISNYVPNPCFPYASHGYSASQFCAEHGMGYSWGTESQSNDVCIQSQLYCWTSGPLLVSKIIWYYNDGGRWVVFDISNPGQFYCYFTAINCYGNIWEYY